MREAKAGGPESIGLALSGGGVRAAAFHAGVLRYLAERGLLENVTHVSSVSGGSLFAGLVFQNGNYRWPTSQAYLDKVLPHVREVLTTTSLQGRSVLRLVLPTNWALFLDRPEVLAQTIGKLWGIKASFLALDETPIWSINCSTGETGRRFRFKSDGTLGDYELGHADLKDLDIATALAASAAFPGWIGPLELAPENYAWKKKVPRDAKEATPFTPPFQKLHIYDGGVYDNLGMEAIFDAGTQAMKEDSGVRYLVVSDAGASVARRDLPLVPHKRVLQLIDIYAEQVSDLRVRAFKNYLRQNPGMGAYAQIGKSVAASIEEHRKERKQAIADALLKHAWLSEEDAKKAKDYPTTLKKMDAPDFDLLARHGHERIKWSMEMMSRS